MKLDTKELRFFKEISLKFLLAEKHMEKSFDFKKVIVTYLISEEFHLSSNVR